MPTLTAIATPDTFTIKGENLVRGIVIDLAGETGFRFDGSGESVGHVEIIHAEPEAGFVDVYGRSLATGHTVHVEAESGRAYNIVG